MSNLSGATGGASPSPTTSASSPSSSSSNTPSTGATGGVSPTPNTTGSNSSATTQNIDIGMGPRSASRTDSPVATEDYGPKWWETHGEHIFKHERFQELLPYKKKYAEVEPIIQSLEGMGGMEQVNALNTYFGPVLNHLVEQGEEGQATWGQLYPILQGVLSGKSVEDVIRGMNINSDNSQLNEVDPLDERINPIKQEINELKTALQKEQEAKQKADFEKIDRSKKETISKYSDLIDKRISSKEVPERLRWYVADILKKTLANYMPKGEDGNPIRPEDHFSEEVFTNAWNKEVKPAIRALQGDFMDLTNKPNDENPALPSTDSISKINTGVLSDQDRAAKFAERLSRAKLGR